MQGPRVSHRPSGRPGGPLALHAWARDPRKEPASMKRTVALGGAVALAGALTFAVGVSAQDPGHPAHPGHIHAGVCPEPGDVVIPLADAAAATDAAQGLPTGIPVRVSITEAELPLADILAAEHSINYHESADTLDVYIACGDLGGPV